MSELGANVYVYAVTTYPYLVRPLCQFAVPLTVYMIGVYRTLAAPDRTGNGPWPMVFLYGAVMMSATTGLQETLYAVLALHGDAGLAVRRCCDRSCRAARR